MRLLLTGVLFLCSLSASAQDICGALFKLGYYDEKSTFTSQQQFTYVQNILKQESDMTYQQATDSKFNLGLNVIGVIDSVLGGSTDATNFQQRRDAYLKYDLSTSSLNSTIITTTKTVSSEAVDAMKACFRLYPGFSVVLTPKSTLDGFAVVVSDNTGNAEVEISSDKRVGTQKKDMIDCHTNFPVTVTPPHTFICAKPNDVTLLITVNVKGKGTLEGVEVYGTDRIIPDLVNDVRALTTAITNVGQASCLGCVEQSILTEAQFQNVNGPNWVLCDGRSIVGSQLAKLTGISNAPDLRGVFLRG